MGRSELMISGRLFSDYYLHMTENSQSNESIDGYPYWVLDYSFRIDDKTNRYGMSILLIRGDKVYEISYIVDSYEEFIRNLDEIRKVIETMPFLLILPINSGFVTNRRYIRSSILNVT